MHNPVLHIAYEAFTVDEHGNLIYVDATTGEERIIPKAILEMLQFGQTSGKHQENTEKTSGEHRGSIGETSGFFHGKLRSGSPKVNYLKKYAPVVELLRNFKFVLKNAHRPHWIFINSIPNKLLRALRTETQVSTLSNTTVKHILTAMRKRRKARIKFVAFSAASVAVLWAFYGDRVNMQGRFSPEMFPNAVGSAIQAGASLPGLDWFGTQAGATYYAVVGSFGNMANAHKVYQAAGADTIIFTGSTYRVAYTFYDRKQAEFWANDFNGWVLTEKVK